MECLHIELTKNAFKATNGKDEYYQMMTWVQRREKTQKHTAYIEWRQRSHQVRDNRASARAPTMNECVHCPRFLKMARHPTAKAVTFDNLSAQYGQLNFKTALLTLLHKSIIPVLQQQYCMHTQLTHCYHFEQFLYSIGSNSCQAIPAILRLMML
jgi:hypothetical protein